MPITPHQITWLGPNGYRVILDEDFVSLRPGAPLEEGEITTLLDVIAEAKRCRDVGTAPIPVAPSLPF